MKSTYKTFSQMDVILRDESNESNQYMICYSYAAVTILQSSSNNTVRDLINSNYCYSTIVVEVFS